VQTINPFVLLSGDQLLTEAKERGVKGLMISIQDSPLTMQVGDLRLKFSKF